MSTSVSLTLGSLLAGCFVAVALSALVGFQTALYYLVFPQDTSAYKVLVGWIWLLDAVHTCVICASVWLYTISNYNNPEAIVHIFHTVPINIILTTIITLSVNAFYGWRIHKLSKGNWWITVPIIILSLARLATGLVTSIKMLEAGSFAEIAGRYITLFTAGVIISAVTDIYISIARYWYLRKLKEGYTVTREMVDTTIVFTINDGALTCVVVIAFIACWVGMPHNYVFLGIYFTLAKLYSNSILATLNLRNWYRHRYNIPRRQQLGVVMTRGGGTSGYPLGKINTPHSQGSAVQSDADKNSEVLHGEESGTHTSPGRIEVIIDTKRQVVYDDQVQLFDHDQIRQEDKPPSFGPLDDVTV
ncbi:hypothetical protein PENSPDRAFT_647168 [Peniophora sp. CONT]|nr:hypothetical protein PENSPDRAFT_647168 [Peniophora sp. CONT]